jgi:hypothetical protein
MIRSILVLIVCVLSLACLGTTPLWAESSQAKEIIHTPIKSTQIPAPGTPMTIIIDLSQFRGVIARERLLVIRDGKLLDVPLLEGVAEGHDSLTHNATIHAPLVELKYQVLITLADGNTVSSPSYTLRRGCVPNIALASIDDPSDSSVSERLKRYVQQSRDLERDLTQYENAITLLESLVGEVKEES